MNAVPASLSAWFHGLHRIAAGRAVPVVEFMAADLFPFFQKRGVPIGHEPDVSESRQFSGWKCPPRDNSRHGKDLPLLRLQLLMKIEETAALREYGHSAGRRFFYFS